MNIFYTSDTHFYHNNIIKYCPNSRGQFNNAEEMNEKIIANWNDKVKDNDVVYHLGDVSFSSIRNTLNIINRLSGEIILIPGNHDHKLAKEAHVTVKSHYLEVKHNNTFIILCHYPILSWNGKEHGSIHLHGHTHGTLTRYHKNALDVGLDARPNNDLTLWEHSELIDWIKNNEPTS